MTSLAEIEAVEVYTTKEPCNPQARIMMEYKGMVMVSKIKGIKKNQLLGDMGSSLAKMAGFEFDSMTKQANDARSDLVFELKEKAAILGANAIVDFRLTYFSSLRKIINNSKILICFSE